MFCKLPSDLLKEIHQEIAPEIPIDSEKFTFRLIEEISKLKSELKKTGDKNEN